MTVGRLIGGAGILVASVVGANESGVLPSFTSEGYCPSGWTQAAATGDDHIAIYSCEQGDVLVILTPDKQFERALVPGVADWVTDPEAVPGWSR